MSLNGTLSLPYTWELKRVSYLHSFLLFYMALKLLCNLTHTTDALDLCWLEVIIFKAFLTSNLCLGTSEQLTRWMCGMLCSIYPHYNHSLLFIKEMTKERQKFCGSGISDHEIGGTGDWPLLFFLEHDYITRTNGVFSLLYHIEILQKRKIDRTHHSGSVSCSTDANSLLDGPLCKQWK